MFDIHTTDDDGWTALHYSTGKGSYDSFKSLADMGADIYLKNYSGMNCLHIAALNGHLNLCKILIDKHNFDVHMADNGGCSALHYSARYGSYKLFRCFVAMRADIYLKSHDGRNCLHIAALHGQLNLCKIIIDKHNFDIDMVDNDGCSALHFSARYGSYELFRYFVDMGANIYLKSHKGRNCLHISALYGHFNLCKTLKDKYNFDVHMESQQGWTALHYSARYGSYKLFRFFLNMGADVYLKNYNGWNCLHIAVLYGHLNLCKMLIDKFSFDIDLVDNGGCSALHYSVRYGSYELFRYFTDMGADIYLKSNNGRNCLHFAAMYGHLNFCKILIDKHNFDVYVADNQGWAALHHSSKYGSYELFRYFADTGADIYLKDHDGRNCLHIAALNGHLNLCKILIDKHNFDVHMADNQGHTALHHSVYYGSFELFRYFADIGDDIYLKTHDGRNCLHIAAMYGHLNLCKMLIDKHNFDINMTDDSGISSLHYSARYGCYKLFRYFTDMGADIYLKSNNGRNCLHIAALYGHLSLCNILKDKYNFDVHMADNHGWAALHHSARYGSYELFRYFVDMGADIYLEIHDGRNCLHIAALYGHLKLCKILIDKHNFDVDLTDNDGCSTLHYSARYGSYYLFRYFAGMVADIYLKNHNGWNCLHIAALYGHLNISKMLIEKQDFDIDMTDNDGRSALHYSVRCGSYKIFRYFADMGADIYLKNENGWNCLHIAALYGHLNLCKILIDKHKFDVDMVDNDGCSALHYSARHGSYEIFRYFAEMGADLYLRNNDGMNCLHIAALNEHFNLCKILINEHSFDVHMTDNHRWAVFHHSARHGNYELFSYFADTRADIHGKNYGGMDCLHIAALNGHLSLCKILIDKHNFDVQMADNHGYTALHHSENYGGYEIFRYLADMGDDIYLKSHAGRNCLHIAALNGHLNLCKILIDEHNFDVNLADNSGWTALHHFARHSSYGFFKYIAGKGADIYHKNNTGVNCLHIAALNGHLNICKILIDKQNFDVDMVDNDGCSALHYSTRFGSYKLFRYFADMGADIYLKNNAGMNCLHIAALNGNLNLCKILIDKHNFDFDMVDYNGFSTLHYSARYGSYKLIRYFADMGADINLKNHNGCNCLHIAALYGHLNLCKMLINKHNFDAGMADNDGISALHYSARYGSYEIFRYFAYMGTDIHLKNLNGWNCLHIAALYGHFNLCKILVDKYNFDVNMVDNDGCSALHYSARYGSYKLFRYIADMGADIYLKNNGGMNCLHFAALHGHLNLCKILIDKYNFDVYMADNHGWTALHHSSNCGSYELFRYFADMQVDIYFKSRDGMNCLHIAALNGHLNLCKLLIDKHNFDIDIVGNFGWAALHHCARYGCYKVFRYLADMKADIYLKNNAGMNCLHIAALYGHLKLCKILIDKHNFEVDMTDNAGRSALHYSARHGSYEIFRYFADMGADIYLKSHNGWNCLHIAALYGHLSLCKILIDKHNFDVDIVDNDGNLALHYCVIYGSYKLFKYFAEMGADVYLKNNGGMNCLHTAALNGHVNLCKILIDQHKFDIYVTDNKGWAAFHHSARHGNYELFRYFADMTADIYLKSYGGINCLHIAALNGHLNLCKILIDKHNFNVHMADNHGCTALHHSANYGSYKIFRYFADMGVDIYRKSHDGRNCLHIAASKGHLNLCKILIDKNYFDADMADDFGWTALHHFARHDSYELFKYFANNGADIYRRNNAGINCLHIAALNGHLNLCKILINEHKFDVDMADNSGWTALHHFARHGSYELFKYFANKGADIYVKNNTGVNCLHIAASNGHMNLCQIFIAKHNFDVNRVDNDGCSALHYSARYGSYKLFRYFADMGADIYHKNHNGWNCLHISALYGHLNLCKILKEKHQFDVHMVSKNGWTALHYSARYGSYKLFTYLANIGADIYLKNHNGWNCLHIAALYGHLNLCKMLVHKQKFDVDMVDNDGRSALHFSARYGSYKLFSYFADIGADIYLKCHNGRNCLHIAALYGHFNLCKILKEKHKFDVHTVNKKGWTAIHFSAMCGNYELFRCLADMGADIYHKNHNGWNCLHIAALYGHLNLCKFLIDKHNFDVHMVSKSGCSALHYSVRYGSYELFRYFAEVGADIFLKTRNGSNCLHIAALNGHLDLCKILIDKHNFDVHMTTNDDWTTLHCSAENGSFKLFSYFLDKNPEIYCKTKNMKNILHLSSRNGHFDICEFVLRYFAKDYTDNNSRNKYTLNGKSYRSQVFYKYDTIFLHAMDDRGNTYLHLAAEGNHAKICELLLRYDTEIMNLLNKKDKTAREIAGDKGHGDVLNALEAEYERKGMVFLFF